MKTSLKDLIISILSSIISGIIVNTMNTSKPLNIPTTWMPFAIAILVGVCVYLSLFVMRCRAHGIIKILGSSIKGEGSTESYMKSATHSIQFVGIASSKWVNNADLLERSIRSICSQNTGYIKFLLLNPKSEAAKKLTLAQNSPNEPTVSQKIEHSLNLLNGIINRISDNNVDLLNKFEIRLYNQMPVYRLTIVDERRAYFCFYQKGCDGSKLKQFVIKPKANSDLSQENIFNSMSEYFDSLWTSKETISYKITNKNNNGGILNVNTPN